MKHIMNKNILLIILCLLISISSFAQNYSGGSGTEGDPYLISSKADMESLATIVNEGNSHSETYFLLTTDLTEEPITVIIGNSFYSPFSGVFDGGNHKISIDINMKNADFPSHVGLFGTINNATIKNLSINGYLSIISSYCPGYGDWGIGAICGYSSSSKIENCGNYSELSFSLNDNLEYEYRYLGGICGYSKSSEINNCYNTGKVSFISEDVAHSSPASSKSLSYSAGICSKIENSIINNSYNIGEIFSSSSSTAKSLSLLNNISASSKSYSGGICTIGDVSSVIRNCYNAGNVFSYSIAKPPTESKLTTTAISYSYSGGINGDGNVKIENCYNVGEILSSSIANKNTGSIGKYKTISSSYSGKISASSSTIIENCYTSHLAEINGDIINENEKNEDISSFLSKFWIEKNLEWDFDEIWKMSNLNSINEGHPILKYQEDLIINSIESLIFNKENDITVYPNPAKSDLYISSYQALEKVEIYNQSGVCVLSNENFIEKLDVSHLPDGFYFARIFTNGIPVTKKIIIKK